MSASIRWTRRALRRLDEIGAYIAKDNSAAAEKVVFTITACVLTLRDHPERGRLGRIQGTRELVVPGTRYIATYRIRGQSVDILSILHAAQNWPRAF